MADRPSISESARLLRQRMEMGAEEIFLDGMTREEALRVVVAAGRARGREELGSAREAAPRTRSEDDKERRHAHGGPARAPSDSPSPQPSTQAEAPLPDDYEELHTLALGCTRCGLAEGRTQVVFSDGPSDARLMVVGEAPGANEDRTGVPFVGAAGKYLDLLLGSVDLSREDSVYIANVLKCRPPGNRDPKTDEIETCSPYLRKQIDLVKPRALLAVGSFAGKLLTDRDTSTLGALRGEVHSYHGVPLVVTYHPAALLRNPNWTRLFWDDLQLLRSVLDAS